MKKQRFFSAVWLLGWLWLGGGALAMPSAIEAGPAPAVLEAGHAPMRLAQAQPTQAPAAAASPAPAADAEPIGNVATLTGTATVTRNNALTPL